VIARQRSVVVKAKRAEHKAEITLKRVQRSHLGEPYGYFGHDVFMPWLRARVARYLAEQRLARLIG
jgi:hypothetical protein